MTGRDETRPGERQEDLPPHPISEESGQGSGKHKGPVWVAVSVVGMGSLIASGFSPHRLDAFGISLLTVSACLVTPRLVTGAFVRVTPEEAAAQSEVLMLGPYSAEGLARILWAVSRRTIIYALAAAAAALIGFAIANAHAHPHSHTELTLWLAAFGYGIGLLAIAFGVVGAILGERKGRKSILRTQRWLRSAEPALLLGSLTFLSATVVQLIATYRRH